MVAITSLKTAIEKQLAKGPNEVSIIELVDRIVEYGYSSRASDIHIDPAEDKVMVRLRIDGILHDTFPFSSELQAEVVSRIKVLSGLKTDIHHAPQDGRFKAQVEGGKDIDIRVSITPTYYGENVVMRLLVDTVQVFTLQDLGFSPDQLVLVENAIQKPFGMILANGPTGSGKTTTLYTILKKLNTREVSIITIEDPIEYSIPGVTQIPVSLQAGLTFANGLRSILRQDPNIIMVGEIRDSETASIAVNAALTGHLVLSTLHTSDAATTFPRLVDMGVPHFLVSSTVNVVIAQRLVRKVCITCRKSRTLNVAELKSLGGIAKDALVEKVYAAGPGCKECNGEGYQGRIGIYEVLEVNDEIRTLIASRADAAQIRETAVKQGMRTMIANGLAKAHEGVTTIEEILRIIHE
ncbi:MAG: GspE/PulE family protein [Candidatus Jorgensenbacteria bacterium]|nr:GspE/PulE family protein [Candidatus Jorgensenbacteria bacterium]